MLSLDTLIFFLQLSLLCLPCRAQTHAFQWTFADSSQQISSFLPECQTLKLLLSSSTNNLTALGTPPYYVMAFEANGFSTTTFVGNDPANLNWQVNHAAGTQLMLGMADANGNAGGMSTPLFTVTSEKDTSCLPSPPSTSLNVTPNVTMDLSTCQPWGLTVTGGSPPYNITLISVGSTVVTNVTLPQGFDAFTYINKANPNGQILAAVSDSTGQFGKTTQVVNTVGSADFTCPGLVSQPGHSSQTQSKSTSHPNSRRTGVIIGVCVTIGCLIGVILFVRIMRQTIRRKHGILDGQDTLPRIFKQEDRHDSARVALLPALHSRPSHHKEPISDTMSTWQTGSSSSASPIYQEIVPYVPSFDSSQWGHHTENSIASSSYSHDRLLPSHPPSPVFSISSNRTANQPQTNTLPVSPPPSADADRRYAKLAEVHHSSREDNIRRAAPLLTSSAAAGSSHRPLLSPPYSAGSRRVDPNVEPDIEPDIIIQHRDGGVVQELPPPYLDRSRDRPPENNDVTRL